MAYHPRPIDLSARPVVMGILNVTPDSFSDGGLYLEPADALRHAERLVEEGADMIDVGAESTRPGAAPVDPAEQIRRGAEIIAALRRRYPAVRISIDTQSAVVAAAALDAGADLINDVSALGHDPEMAGIVADAGAWVILMHMRGTPQTMQHQPRYQDVVSEVYDFLTRQIERAVSAGIDRSRIIIDPGFGFGKTVDHNLRLLAAIGRFVELAPVLVGTSRKSFISRVLGLEHPNQDFTGTVITNTVALRGGARILRVHDVLPARHAITLCEALRAAADASPSFPGESS